MTVSVLLDMQQDKIKEEKQEVITFLFKDFSFFNNFHEVLLILSFIFYNINIKFKS